MGKETGRGAAEHRVIVTTRGITRAAASIEQ